MPTPASLPADFFSQKAPDSLPSDFFARSEEKRKHSLKGSPKKSASADVANLIEGTAKYSSGALLPATVLAPEATAIGVVGSLAGGQTGRGISRSLNMTPDHQRLAGDLSSIVGGSAALKAAPYLGELASSLRGLKPDVKLAGPEYVRSASRARAATRPQLPEAAPKSQPYVNPIQGKLPSGRKVGPRPPEPGPKAATAAEKQAEARVPSPRSKLPTPDDIKAVDASTKVAGALKHSGITHELARRMTDAEWDQLGEHLGIGKLDAAARRAVLNELKPVPLSRQVRRR